MKQKKKKKLKIILLSFLAVLILLFGGFYVYTLDYYRTSGHAAQTLAGLNDQQVEMIGDTIIFYPDKPLDSGSALIFYPGGKVEYTAYVPLLEQLAQRGLTCVLVKMPFNLAVFGINRADSVYAELPEIKDWYLAGHSLGGAMASSYAGKNSDKLDGLILLGAYPVNDSDIPTIAIYGSEDINLDRTKLVNTANQVEIVGGNHAYFGDYGEQKGDGIATISREEQQKQAVDAIMRFINDQSSGLLPVLYRRLLY